ncbi:hypothetical protein ACFSTE_21455 [Aquimarina hainanensis]|uniref:Uncharacterized protein n=1 Tax=Aquimarina hainanensis TaxID=1578017 RepID=A0ABW5NFS1_9FLAO|nr:hypothetical protein [Aquimarina sp. TRL1]QKX07276.1 hypothetical protein HN014_20965 [Aquimarina sp. TRL1]
MNNRILTKYAIYTVAVLSATLINEYIIKYVKKHIDLQGYLLVLMDMLVVVLIFAPAFALVSEYTKKISKAYIKTSKKVSSNNRSGITLGFLAALIILFILFALLRHNIHVINDLKKIISK